MKDKKVYESYQFLWNKIVESCKKKNVTNIDINRKNNTLKIYYKNKNIIVEIKDSIIKTEWKVNKIGISFINSFEFGGVEISSAILFYLILWLIFIPKAVAIILGITFILSVVWAWAIPIFFLTIMVFLFIRGYKLLGYIFNVVLEEWSILSKKIFKKDYISLIIFKLAYKYHIGFIQKIWIKHIMKSEFNTRIDYDYTYLSPTCLIDLDKIKILSSDNMEINLGGDIKQITKYKVWKEVINIALILNKFYNLYNNIEEIINNDIKNFKDILNDKIEYTKNIDDPKIKKLIKQEKKYLEEIKELDDITNSLRKLYWQPKNIEVFEEIDKNLSEINKSTNKLNIINRKLNLLNKKLSNINDISKNIEKYFKKTYSEMIIKFYLKYFNILITFYKNVSPYTKSKIIEINNKIIKLIQEYHKELDKNKNKILIQKSEYENEIKKLLSESKDISNKIFQYQKNIKDLKLRLSKEIN